MIKIVVALSFSVVLLCGIIILILYNRPTQTECECPIQTECECPIQTECECPTQTECECPIQTECECPTQTECECPIQTECECPTQTPVPVIYFNSSNLITNSDDYSKDKVSTKLHTGNTGTFNINFQDISTDGYAIPIMCESIENSLIKDGDILRVTLYVKRNIINSATNTSTNYMANPDELENVEIIELPSIDTKINQMNKTPVWVTSMQHDESSSITVLYFRIISSNTYTKFRLRWRKELPNINSDALNLLFNLTIENVSNYPIELN